MASSSFYSTTNPDPDLVPDYSSTFAQAIALSNQAIATAPGAIAAGALISANLTIINAAVAAGTSAQGDALSAGNSANSATDSAASALASAISAAASAATAATYGTGALFKSNNLSDLTDASVARSNLGLGSLATKNTASISDTTGLQSALDGKAALSHTHVQSDITGLSTSLAGKANTTHIHAIADVTSLQTTLDGKSALGHGHNIADVADLQTTLNGKAANSHNHAIADVSGLQTTLDGKQAVGAYLTSINYSQVTAALGFTPANVGGQEFVGGVIVPAPFTVRKRDANLEGGAIILEKAPNSSLNGNLHFDIYGSAIRFFEDSAPYRGIYVDIAACDSQSLLWHSSNLTNLNQLTNGPGYISGINSGMVTAALGYTPYNATNPNGYISGINSGNVTTALGYTPARTDGVNAAGTWPIDICGNTITRVYGGGGTSNFSYMDASGIWKTGDGNHTYWHGGNLTNLNQLANGPGYYNSSNFTWSASGGSSTLVQRDPSGYISNNYFNSTDDVSGGSISYIMAKFGDNYYRSATAQKVWSFIGDGGAYSTRIQPYSYSVGAEHFNAPIEIREAGGVGSAQSDHTYAPSIGFHWAGRTAATIALQQDTHFHFRAQGYAGGNQYRNIYANDFKTGAGAIYQSDGNIYMPWSGTYLSAELTDRSRLSASNTFTAAYNYFGTGAYQTRLGDLWSGAGVYASNADLNLGSTTGITRIQNGAAVFNSGSLSLASVTASGTLRSNGDGQNNVVMEAPNDWATVHFRGRDDGWSIFGGISGELRFDYMGARGSGYPSSGTKLNLSATRLKHEGTLESGVDVVANNSVLAKSGNMYIDSDGNRHLWYRTTAGVNRGLLYHDNGAAQMNIDLYNSGGAYACSYVFKEAGGFYFPGGHITNNGNLYMSWYGGYVSDIYRTIMARVWGCTYWDGGTMHVDGSYGVNSVTRNGIGDYTVTHAGLKDHRNAIVVSPHNDGSTQTVAHNIYSQTSNQFRVFFATNAGAASDMSFNFIIFNYAW